MTIETKDIQIRPAIAPSEHEEQVALFDYLHTFKLADHPELHPLYFAVGNGIPLLGNMKARSKIMNYMKSEGLTPGVADTIFLSGHGGYLGMALELKAQGKASAKDKGLSENQVEFLEAARMEGYRTDVAFGAEHAIEILNNYLSMPKTQEMVFRALRHLERGEPEAAKLILKEVTLAW